ncbi:MAG TPA: hypothetical protein PKW90_28310, partial [Myxococcota bacterium]|nr:hypothetical protein [Myxococcota bacterium]
MTLLELPARNWLAQQVFQQSQGRWLIGIPDDWATTGGTVTVLHQGRKVCTRRLEHAEIAFVMLCELEESQFNDVWDDVAPKAWKELEPGWLHCVEEVLKGMSAERAPQGALRTYLIEHLSRSERPQDSYFAKTLLFQDWNDKVYSLYQLLRLGPGQVLGVVDPSQKPVEEWVPLGVYVRSSGWEARVLKKVTALKVMEVGYLLQDLAQARGEVEAYRLEARDKAREEVEELRRAWRARLADEQAAFERELETMVVDTAVDLATRAVSELSGDRFEAAVFLHNTEESAV